jgi:hypothetical protein
MTVTKLTKAQAEILLHRLHVPDAMIDNYEQEDGTHQIDGKLITVDDVMDACDECIESIERDGTLPENPSPMVLEVLANAVELSTFYGCHVGRGLHPLKVAGILRSGKALAKVVTSYIKRHDSTFQGELVYPDW